MKNDAREQTPSVNRSRRDFVRRAVYVAPLVLTLPAAPALAQSGSAAPIQCPGGTAVWDPNYNVWTCNS